MESLTEAKKANDSKMMLRTFLFALFLCLAAAPVQAQWWPFSKKSEEPQKVFNNAPQIESAPEKKWALDGVLNRTLPADKKDVVINGVTIKGLTQEMLNASYAPKSVEEIGAIAMAHKGWEAGAMEEMEQKAQERIAAAEKQNQEGLKELASGQYGAPAAQSDAGGQAVPEEKPKTPQLFNKPVLEKPGKVFKGYP